MGNWFTGANAGIDLQQLTLLQQSIDAGTATATAEQARPARAAQRLQRGPRPVAGDHQHDRRHPHDAHPADRRRLRRPHAHAVGAPRTVDPVRHRRRLAAARRDALRSLDRRPGDRVHARPGDPQHRQSGRSRRPSQTGCRRTDAASRQPWADSATSSAACSAACSPARCSRRIGLDFYFIVAAFVAFSGVMFVIFARDRSSKDLEVAPFKWKRFFVGFTIALRDRNYRWVWVARILLTFGYTVSTALSLYMLQSYVHPALSQAEATALAPLLLLAGVPVTILAVLVAGKLSDKLGKRRIFVIVASVLMGLSMLIPIVTADRPRPVHAGDRRRHRLRHLSAGRPGAVHRRAALTSAPRVVTSVSQASDRTSDRRSARSSPAQSSRSRAATSASGSRQACSSSSARWPSSR